MRQQKYPVGEEEGLFDVVSNHQDGLSNSSWMRRISFCSNLLVRASGQIEAHRGAIFLCRREEFLPVPPFGAFPRLDRKVIFKSRQAETGQEVDGLIAFSLKVLPRTFAGIKTLSKRVDQGKSRSFSAS